MIELKQVNKDMGFDEYKMLQGIENGENGFMNEVFGMSFAGFKEWLIMQEDFHLGKNLPQGWIPYTTYFLYDNGLPIGIGRVRHETSEYLQKVVGAGEIGYGISKDYRGKGYGMTLVKNLLNLSINEDVYLVSKEHNLEFYKKCGFEIVKEIYDNKG